MKRIFVLIALFASFFTNTVFSQPTIRILEGTTPVIDGIVVAGEWDDAESVELTAGSGWTTEIRYKHDGEYLYLAFLGNLESRIRFPEVVIDVRNDRGFGWLDDDWWFHASATDCESNGVHSDYTACAEIQSGWQAVPNMTSEPERPNIDTMELAIAFAKIDLDPANSPLVGIAFDVTNTATAWDMWPPDANLDSPATWASGEIVMGVVSVEDRRGNHAFDEAPPLTIAPNPMITDAVLTFPNSKDQHVELSIYNALGVKIATIINDVLSAGVHEVYWNGANAAGRRSAAGRYTARLRIGAEQTLSPIIIIR